MLEEFPAGQKIERPEKSNGVCELLHKQLLLYENETIGPVAPDPHERAFVTSGLR